MKKGLDISDSFSISKDKYQWIVHETYIGKDKHGNPKGHTKETYHATIKQACNKILNELAGRCETAEEIITMFDNTAEMLANLIEVKVNEQIQR